MTNPTPEKQSEFDVRVQNNEMTREIGEKLGAAAKRLYTPEKQSGCCEKCADWNKWEHQSVRCPCHAPEKQNVAWEERFDEEFLDSGGSLINAKNMTRAGTTAHNIKAFITRELDAAKREVDSTWYLAIAHLDKVARDKVIATRDGLAGIGNAVKRLGER